MFRLILQLFSFRKQCIYSDSRLDFLKELMKNIPDLNEELSDMPCPPPPPIVLAKEFSNSESDEEAT